MNFIKRFTKNNSHSLLVKPFAGFGRSINRFYENRNHHPETNGEVNLLKKISKTYPKIIFDVGANVGDYAQWARICCPNAKIYSFEPVNGTFKILQKNILERKTKNVVAINKGFYHVDKEILINIYRGHEHSSIHDLKGDNYSVVRQDTIEVVNGDNLVEELQLSTIDFLKLDIEGAEMDALLGFNNSFKEKKIRAVQFEYGYINITSKKLLCDYYDFFSSHGYRVGKIYPKGIEFRDYAFKHEDFIGPNFVAIHSSDMELYKLLS